MYFLTKQNSSNTCFTSSCENVYSRGIYQYAQFPVQHTLLSLSPRLTRIVTKRYSLIGLQHPSSSSIHKQASVHARLFILQLQLRLQLDVVQRHVSSLMPDGTGGLVIRTEINLSLSNFHSFPSGEGTFLSDTRALLQTKA